MRYILVILFLFSGAVKVSAFFERGLSAAAGSNPKGANINASLAYNQLLWDGRSQNDESRFWKYGYLRPKVYYETSYVINTVSAELQVYPISIFGGSVGYKNSDRAVKSLELYECDKVNCQGQVTKSFYNLNLNLGYGSWVMALIYENTQLKASSDIPPLVEYSRSVETKSVSARSPSKVTRSGSCS